MLGTPEVGLRRTPLSLDKYLGQNPAKNHAKIIAALESDPSAQAIALDIQPPQIDKSIRNDILKALKDKKIEEDKKEFILSLLQFIEGPTITDNFDQNYGATAHDKRRNWRIEMYNKHKKDFYLFYQENRLRRNKMLFVSGIIAAFGPSEFPQNLVNEASQFQTSISQEGGYDNYDQLSLAVKLQKVAEAESLARRAIQELIK